MQILCNIGDRRVDMYGLLCLWNGTGMGRLGGSHVPIPILPS